MANKFIIHGATYCGDGTDSNEAASPGAPGAWNDLWSTLLGTAPAYGTIDAGDYIKIRALDSGGGSLSAVYTGVRIFGSANATSSGRILWELDDGTTWPGVTGDITISMTTYNNSYIRAHNLLSGSPGQRNWAFNLTSGDGHKFYLTSSEFHNGHLNCGGSTSGWGSLLQFYSDSILRNVKITGHTWNTRLIEAYDYSGCNFYGVDFVGLNSSETDALIKASLYGGTINWVGGSISGAWADAGRTLVTMQNGTGGVNFTNVRMPYNVVLCGVVNNTGQVYVSGADSVMGVGYRGKYFSYDTRDDGFYPTLNAVMRLSTATPFSYKVYPFGVSEQYPATLKISKLWNQPAAPKTITLNFLWPATMAAPTEHSTWMEISYIDDSTGDTVHRSTRVFGSSAEIAPSSAAWTNTSGGVTSYGPTQLYRYKLELATPSSIRQDSLVTCVFNSSVQASSDLQVLFVCSDVQLT